MLYYEYAENKNHEVLHNIRLDYEFQHAGRRFALFSIYRDERGIMDSSGEHALLAELRDSKWQEVCFLDDHCIESAHVSDGKLFIQSDYRHQTFAIDALLNQ